MNKGYVIYWTIISIISIALLGFIWREISLIKRVDNERIDNIEAELRKAEWEIKKNKAELNKRIDELIKEVSKIPKWKEY